MDLQEQRLTCLRMALEMGCKSDTIVKVATELQAFLSGVAPAAANSGEERSDEVIAACGTALVASEAADLVAQAEPAGAADAPAAAAISRETLLEPLPTPSEVPAAQEISAAAVAEVAVEPIPAQTTVGVQSGELAPTSKQSRTEPASAAEASKVADDEHTSAQATEVAAATNGVAQGGATGAAG
jgi:hypothetical protein